MARHPPQPKPSHRTAEIVLSAIKKLTRNTGWTTRTIIKFIKTVYGARDSKQNSRKISRALKRGVRLGILKFERGRYRLNDLSRQAKSVTALEIRKNQKTSRVKLVINDSRKTCQETQPQRKRSQPLRKRSQTLRIRDSTPAIS